MTDKPEPVEARVCFMHRVRTNKGGYAHKFAQQDARFGTPMARTMIFDLKSRKLVPGGLYTVKALLDADDNVTTIYHDTLAFKAMLADADRALRMQWEAADAEIGEAKDRTAAERKVKAEGGIIEQETRRLYAIIAKLPRGQRRAVIHAISLELDKAVWA